MKSQTGEGSNSSTAVKPGDGGAYNSLLFVSLILALITASAGTLVKQWIQQYLEEDFDSTPYHHVCMRQYRYDGLERWRVPLFVGLLPVLLRVSFILFATGLAIRLYDFDHAAAISLAVLEGIWIALSISAAISPLLSNSCPYRSPESLLILNIGSFAHRLFTSSSSQLLKTISWLERDHGVVIPHGDKLGGGTLAQALSRAWDQVEKTKEALSGVEDHPELHPDVEKTLKPPKDSISTISEPEPHVAFSMAHKLDLACKYSIELRDTLIQKCGGDTFKTNWAVFFGRRRKSFIEEVDELVRDIERALSIARALSETTKLGMKALITAFFDFAPSNPPLAVTIGLCAQTFHTPEALQIVHRVGFERMGGSKTPAPGYIEPRDWRELWKHWDTSGDTVIRIRRLTRSGSKMLLLIVSNAVSAAYIDQVGNEALKKKSDMFPIGDIAEPASSCIATLLLGGGLRVDTDLRKSIAQAILKLLADYREQGLDFDPGQSSPDGWRGASLVAFRAATRLCLDAPEDEDDIFGEPNGFTVSKREFAFRALFGTPTHTLFRQDRRFVAECIESKPGFEPNMAFCISDRLRVSPVPVDHRVRAPQTGHPERCRRTHC